MCFVCFITLITIYIFPQIYSTGSQKVSLFNYTYKYIYNTSMYRKTFSDIVLLEVHELLLDLK